MTMKIERIEEELRKTQPVVPKQTRARVLKRVEEATAEHRVLPVRSGSWWQPRTALVWRCAGVMAVLGLVYMGFMMTSPGQSTAAFAQVEQAMQEIKTARWISKKTSRNADGSLIYELTEETWIRLDPPAKAVRPLPGTSRSSSNISLHDTRYVLDKRGQVIYNATTKEFTTHPNAIPRITNQGSKDVEAFLRKMLLGHVLSPDIKNKQAPMKSGGVKITYEIKSERVTLDGRSLIRFDREYSRTGFWKVKHSIWADPVTNRVVRSESQQTPSDPGGLNVTYVVVNDQYRYDEEPPGGTFDLKPPPGVRVKIISPPAFALSPRKVSHAELRKAQVLINRSEAAWRNGDFETFAALWDFNFDSKLTGGTAPAGALRRADWKRRVENNTGRVSRLVSRIDPTSVGQFFSDGSKSPSTKRGEPDVLMVEVVSSGAWVGKGSTWKDRRVPYFFRRVNGELRIVNWNLLRMWGGSYPVNWAKKPAR